MAGDLQQPMSPQPEAPFGGAGRSARRAVLLGLAGVVLFALVCAFSGWFIATRTKPSAFTVTATLVKHRPIRPDAGVNMVTDLPRSAVFNIPLSKEFRDRVAARLKARKIDAESIDLAESLKFSTDPKDIADTYVIFLTCQHPDGDTASALMDEAIVVYREMFDELRKRPTAQIMDYYSTRLASVEKELKDIRSRLESARAAASSEGRIMTLDLQASLRNIMDNWALARRRRVEVEASLIRAREEVALFADRAAVVQAERQNQPAQYAVPDLPMTMNARLMAVESAVLEAERGASPSLGPTHPKRQELERLYILRNELRQLANEFSMPVETVRPKHADALEAGAVLAANSSTALVKGLERELRTWEAYERGERDAATRFAEKYDAIAMLDVTATKLDIEAGSLAASVQACHDALETPLVGLLVSQSPSVPEKGKGVPPVVAAMAGLVAGLVVSGLALAVLRRQKHGSALPGSTH